MRFRLPGPVNVTVPVGVPELGRVSSAGPPVTTAQTSTAWPRTDTLGVADTEVSVSAGLTVTSAVSVEVLKSSSPL
ncbi:hypothetical protein Asp14428_13810 [Actinoplanes sp. NBRC 14428]|nr:hypothetical protein Asp14428_13810 [Actinoplanes sp. NBRC 14428]